MVAGGEDAVRDVARYDTARTNDGTASAVDSNSFANRGLLLFERSRVNTSKQEALWVLRAQCDDREALELLLRSVQPSLHRYLCGLAGRNDADDLLQRMATTRDLIARAPLVWTCLRYGFRMCRLSMGSGGRAGGSLQVDECSLALTILCPDVAGDREETARARGAPPSWRPLRWLPAGRSPPLDTAPLHGAAGVRLRSVGPSVGFLLNGHRAKL
jgi:hypothetical protein